MTSYSELYVDQGANWNHIITLTDDVDNSALDITGFSVSSQIRRSAYSQNASANIVCTISNAEAGEITLSMSHETTSALRPGRYVFDVRTVDTANVASRILEGTIYVTPAVTR